MFPQRRNPWKSERVRHWLGSSRWNDRSIEGESARRLGRLALISVVILRRNRSPTKIVWAESCIFIIVVTVIMRSTIVARTAEKMRLVRDWCSYAVPNGQVVRRGKYYFAWSRGYFVGAYETLEDALESLAFRNGRG